MNTSPEQMPSVPATSASRRRPFAIAAGATALALAGAALVSLPSSAVADDANAMPRMHAQAPDHMRPAERMQHRGEGDPAERAAHMAELAGQLGVDADALVATMEALRADLDVDRAALMELEPEARRDAMRAFADERREIMTAALEELGVDPAVLAEHRAEHGAEREMQHGAGRGPQQHRGGPGMGR